MEQFIGIILLLAILWGIFSLLLKIAKKLTKKQRAFTGMIFLLIISYVAFADHSNKTGWFFAIWAGLTFLGYLGMENDAPSDKSNRTKRKIAKRVLTWEEQVADAREHVGLYFKQNKVGDLHDIKNFLVKNQCMADGDKIWLEIVDEINSLVEQGKIEPLAGQEHVWESQYAGAKIQTKIISLD